jgi:hypothetical protein
MSTYYRAQAQKCLALSLACSDRTQGAQLAFMANRYFERAKELEQEEVRFQSRFSILKKRGRDSSRLLGPITAPHSDSPLKIQTANLVDAQ